MNAAYSTGYDRSYIYYLSLIYPTYCTMALVTAATCMRPRSGLNLVPPMLLLLMPPAAFPEMEVGVLTTDKQSETVFRFTSTHPLQPLRLSYYY